MTDIAEVFSKLEALRKSAEEDVVRAVLGNVLSSGEATDKFSGWVLAAAGGFIALQFSVASTVAPRAPRLMLTTILITVVSLFIGALVRLMVYNTDLARMMDGIDKAGKEVRDRYETEIIEQLRHWEREGSILVPLPEPSPLNFERINKNVTTLVNLKQRWLPHFLFESVDKIVGLMVPNPLPETAVDEEFEGLDRPVRLATAAQYWSVVQLVVLIVAVAVGAIGYWKATMSTGNHIPPSTIPSNATPLPDTKLREEHAKEGIPLPAQSSQPRNP